MLYVLFTILHVIISLLLCVVVLMQSGKSGGLAGAFGGGGGLPQQMFGSKAMSTALNKMTIYLAVGFFLTSAILFILTGDRNEARSVIGDAIDEGTLTSETASDLSPSDVAPIEPAVDDAPVSDDGGGN